MHNMEIYCLEFVQSDSSNNLVAMFHRSPQLHRKFRSKWQYNPLSGELCPSRSELASLGVSKWVSPLARSVRPTWAQSIGLKSRTRPAAASVSQRQGCPSRGGICRKLEAKHCSDEQKSYQALHRGKVADETKAQ